MAGAESDYAMYGRLQTEAEIGHSHVKNKICEQCEEEKPIKAFCVECQEYLCEECSVHHCRPRLMRHHRLLKEKEMPRKKITKLISENCIKHSDEINKFFCEGHTECCCHVCVATLHKSCEVKVLSIITKNYLTSEEYGNSKKDLQLINNLVRAQIEKIEKKVESNKKSVDIALEELHKHRNDINKHFDEIEKELQTQAMNIQAEDADRMRSLSTYSKTLLKEIEEMKDDLSVLEDTKQEKLLFASIKTNEKRIEKIKTSLREVATATKVRLVKYCRSRISSSMTIRKDLLGYLQTYMDEEKKEIQDQEMSHAEKGEKEGEMGKEKLMKEKKFEEKAEKEVKTQEVKKIEKTKGEKQLKTTKEEAKEERKVHGLDDFSSNQYECQNCEMGRTHFNCQNYYQVLLPKHLKMSETIYTVLDYLKSKVSLHNKTNFDENTNITFSTGPWDMAQVETKMLAVTLPHEKKIKYLYVDTGIEEANEITTPGFCRSIASVCNCLVVTFSEPAGLKLLSKSGEVLWDIPMMEDGNVLFRAPSSVAVADKNIFVTDPVLNTVTRMSANGETEKILRHKDLIQPSFICYDNDILFVSLTKGSIFLAIECDLETIETLNIDDVGHMIGMRIANKEGGAFSFIFLREEDEENSSDTAENEINKRFTKKSKKQCIVS